MTVDIKPFIAIAFVSLFTLVSKAQISGTLQAEDKSPKSNINVYLSNGQSVQTNATGNFKFNNVLSGNYLLSAQLEEQLVILTSFNHQVKTDLGIILVDKNIQLKEAVITNKQVNRFVERLPDVRDNVIYAGKKNEVVRLSTATANLAQNNSRQLFAKVPGIQVWESDGSGVQMGIASRGLSPNRMWEFNTRQNGYDISSDPFGYPEAYYTPSVESLDRIEIIRGASSLQFGAQFGGVVNYIKKQSISGKKVGVESMQTFGNYGMFSSFNAVGGSYKKFNYYGNINYRTSNGWRENNQYNTWNGYVNLGYQFTNKIKANVEFTRMDQLVQQPGGLTDSLFNLNAQQSTRGRNWFNLQWNIPSVNIDYHINNQHKLNVKAFGLIGKRNSIGYLDAINKPDTMNSTTGLYAQRRIDVDEYKNFGVEARHLYNYSLLNQKQILAAGVRYFNGNTARFRNRNGNRNTNYDLTVDNEARELDLKFATNNMAFFAENIFNINSRLSITPGIRYELLQNTVSGKYATTTDLPETKSDRKFLLLGIGSQYKITSNTNIYANYSEAYRPVLFSDLTPANTLDSIDQNLIDAKGYNIDLGYRGTVSNWLSFDASVFYLLYDNRIGTYSVNGKNYRTNIGTSVSKGFEGYFEVSPTALTDFTKFGHVSLFASLAFINATYTKWYNPDASKDLTNKKVENAPSNIHRFGITYAIKKMSFTYQHSFVSSAFADALNTETPNASAQVGLIPAYNVGDLSFSLKVKKQFNINGGVNNIFNTMYFTRRAGGYPGPGLLPADGRLIYIGVGIKI